MATKELTRDRYLERKGELEQHLEAAKAEHRRIALQAELGSASPADAAAARETVAAIEDRLTGLDGAMQEAQEAAARAAAIEDAKRRQEASKKVEGLLKRREKAFGALAEIFEGVGPHISEIAAVNDAIRNEMAPHRGNSRDPRGFAEFGRQVTEWTEERHLLAGILFGQGLSFDDVIGFQQAYFRSKDRDFREFVRMRSGAIARLATAILEGEG